MKPWIRILLCVLPAMVCAPVLGAPGDKAAGASFSLPAPPPLTGIAPPRPDLTPYVANHDALVVLGKALFWDRELRGRGVACATCHFRAGAGDALLPAEACGLKAPLRDAPSVINAVFFRRGFWDGRADDVFNGRNPWGRRDPDAIVLKHAGQGWSRERVAIANLALASLSTDPVMLCSDRPLADLGRVVLPRRPLAAQKVNPRDSVLGPYLDGSGVGLIGRYADWVRKAFRPEWWSGGVVPDGWPQGGRDHMEANFPLFWGIALAAYQATLVSDDSRYDRASRRQAGAVFSRQEWLGFQLFRSSSTGCITCHGGPLFSGAALTDHWVDRIPSGEGPRLVDGGFFNLGLDRYGDPGVGARDPWGRPLSLARRWLDGFTEPAVDGCRFLVPLTGDAGSGCRPKPFTAPALAVDGAFKTPSLRNVALTPPYFHSGEIPTLDEAIAVFRKGGEKLPALALSFADQAALVAFLKTLTDDRVRCEGAPFDHPALTVVRGGGASALELPAVGADGLPGLHRACLD
ncbi:MAG: cytochrome-c peroxidase [Solirubrobacterales bacterium]